MKPLFLLTLCLLLGGCSEKKNLIKNGNFEKGMQGWHESSGYFDVNGCAVNEQTGLIEKLCQS